MSSHALSCTAFGLRARARLHRPRLVSELAEGANPDATPERAVCAAQLVSFRHRNELAAGLDRVVELAAAPPRPLRPLPRPEVPLDHHGVRAARDALIQLAKRLRAEHEVTPRGMAIVEEMLRSGASPLYVHHYDGDVDDEARRARVALDAG